MKKFLLFSLSILAIASVAAGVVSAQERKRVSGGMQCNDQSWGDRQKSHCEINEVTMAATGSLSVDGRTNGGVAVKGWDRNEVLLRSKIQTNAATQAEADQLAKQIRIETAGLSVHAEGPEHKDGYNWSVSFEVFVPRRTNLSLAAHNGGISIVGVSGKIDFTTTNGGVNLSEVSGSVNGTTTNGGANIELTGTRWDGEGLNVKTTNGGVMLTLPDNYSAHLETGTVNGRISSDIPLNVPMSDRGRMPQDISVDIGSGGPTVRVTTTNGGVRLQRISAQ